MAEEKLLTIREVAHILGVTEREVIDLAESGVMPAYKIGGVYLRFKQPEVEAFKKRTQHTTRKQTPEEYTSGERVSDFFYYYDFYILAALIITLIVLFIVKG